MWRNLTQAGLWRNAAFLRLWSAATISTYGSLVTRTALPFTAILLLDASPAEIGALRVAELLPGFLFGLVAGAWVDRTRRRPLMIATDVGRALLLATIPVAALAGSLGLHHLYVVAALVSVFSVVFDIAYQSYLPLVVRRDELIEANSNLSAAMSVAEASAFSTGGWLVQILTAPLAILVDAFTFLASAAFVARIRVPEPRGDEASAISIAAISADIREGLRAVWENGLLRGMAAAGMAQNLAFGLVGTVFLLYVNQELGFAPGILGMVFAVGGISSLLGALVAGRLPRYGIGVVMIVSLALATIGEALVPLAIAANTAGLLLLIGQQLLADSALTVYDINQVSLRQAIAPAHVLGRINASMRVAEVGALLLGTILAGYLGETVGLRGTLWLGVACTAISAGALVLSPVRNVRRLPSAPLAVEVED
jgi:MFS family permease